MKKKIKDILPVIFVLAVILIIALIMALFDFMYEKDLQLEYLLIARIIDLFFTNISGFMYVVGGIAYFVLYVRFDYRLKTNKLIKVGTIIGLLTIVIFITNIFQEELSVIDGKKKNRFQVIALIARDCVENETETIVVDEFEVEMLSVHVNGGRHSSGHYQRTWYVKMNDGNITLIDDSCVDALANKAKLVGKTEFVVYKNSKIIKSIDGVPLTEYRDYEVDAVPWFELQMSENGHIDIAQVVTLKWMGDISGRCQVCFVKDGEIRAGFGVDDVKNDVRGARYIGDGVFEVYLMHGPDICSNIIRYERKGDTFEVLKSYESVEKRK